MLEDLINKAGEVIGSIGTLGYFLSALAAYFYYSRILYPYYLSPLRNLPRPKSGLWHYYSYLRQVFQGNASVNMDLSLKYGPIVHVKDKIVLVNDPIIRKSFTTYKFAKAESYSLFSINGPNLFSTTDKDFHQRIKKLILPAFNNKTLDAMEPTIYRVGSESLVQYLDSFMDQEPSKEFDLFHLFHTNTLDVISELVFGETLNTTWDKKKGIYYIDELAKTQYMAFLRTIVPFYNHIKYPMEKLFMPVIMENINKRRNSNEIHNDILQSMIDSKDPETGEKLSDQQIVDECMVLLFAGMDTTANTLTWTLYEIIKHPGIYELVSNEIIEKFPNLNEPISLNVAKNELKYLSAAILEAMRMHPVASGALPREVPEGGITINGHYLPPKTVIAIDIYTQNNDPNFWENPRKFDLSRWLGPNAEINKNRLFTFGIGTRSCIGRDLAKNEIYLVLSNLIRHFSFELVDKELTPNNKFLYKPKEKRFKVKLSRRV
ncbi:cytochrome P450 [Conidiobolus coronatus NRRL 28638]|uniref:Cytochrome P450 n=1 Tax=Conidiobolus coronatus (strain ATCC 28846 / CBS 209.66 / NRRL 28638) TaxID=796925 RepID=A0A137PI70_CONC2|nr:cytochrome P450 [Conidiobolus coronatus NRRL 28638]|eukprot:KXN74696.1 cytochrome P450 [Conidiobolus coronatus NRRL 28638]